MQKLLILIFLLSPLSTFAYYSKQICKGDTFILLEWETFGAEAFGALSLNNQEFPLLQAHLNQIEKTFGNISQERLLPETLAYFSNFKIPDMIRSVENTINGRNGPIVRTSSIEAYFFEEHLKYSASDLREFRTIIFEKNGTYKAFQAIGLKSNGSAPSFSAVGLIPIINKYLANGWKLQIDLHNHPFSTETIFGNSGVLSPSPADESAFLNVKKDYGTTEAWISNGFETLRIPL